MTPVIRVSLIFLALAVLAGVGVGVVLSGAVAGVVEVLR